MSTILLRRTLSAAIAGVCIVLIAAFVAGSLQGAINPKEASLALRIDATRTRVFFSVTDPALFRKLFDRFVVAATGTEPLDLASLPKGNRYECALLRRPGAGDAWVIYVHTPETKGHTTLLSASDPSLFLPLSQASASLARTGLVRTYVDPKDAGWLFAESSFVLREPEGIFGRTIAAILRPARHLLVLWHDPESGIVLLEAPRPKVFQPAPPEPSFASAPLLRMSIGDAAGLSVLPQILGSSPDILEGAEGILRNVLESRTGKSGIALFAESMLSGPASFTVMRRGGGVALGISGKARNTHELRQWSELLAASAAGETAVREVTFPKNENVRRDVTEGQKPEAVSLGTMNGWQMTVTGSGSASPLYIAIRGRDYAAATDGGLLTEIIGNGKSEEYAKGADAGAAILGTMDAGWIQGLFGVMPEQTSGSSKAEFRSLVGESAARIRWSAKPVDGGWMLRWNVFRNAPTPPSRGLVN